MHISAYKKIYNFFIKNLGIVFLLLTLLITSYVLIFASRNIYFAMVQEIAIINLKRDLIITKVQKAELDKIIQKNIQKTSPLSSINFSKLKNPFKSEDLNGSP